jgi:hypothetical protein
MNKNQELIERFYTAFSNQDGQTMADCYHQQAQFNDPVFGILDRTSAVAMWTMLLERSKGNLKIEYFNPNATDDKGTVTWVATYNFSKTQRKVVNVIQASFEFKDGLIYRHTDTFNLWKWSKQAFGIKGLLLGWTSFMQDKIRKQAKTALTEYQSKKK